MLATMLLAGVGCRLVELAGPPSQHGQREERTTGSIFVTTAVTTRASGDVIYSPCGEVNREIEYLFKEMEGLV